jgi:hypothetical protein
MNKDLCLTQTRSSLLGEVSHTIGLDVACEREEEEGVTV